MVSNRIKKWFQVGKWWALLFESLGCDSNCTKHFINTSIFSLNLQSVCVCARSVMSNLATPWTVAHQDPLSMEFSKQGYWSGSPFPTPCALPRDRTPVSCVSCIGRQILYQPLHHLGSPFNLQISAYEIGRFYYEIGFIIFPIIQLWKETQRSKVTSGFIPSKWKSRDMNPALEEAKDLNFNVLHYVLC